MLFNLSIFLNIWLLAPSFTQPMKRPISTLLLTTRGGELSKPGTRHIRFHPKSACANLHFNQIKIMLFYTMKTKSSIRDFSQFWEHKRKIIRHSTSDQDNRYTWFWDDFLEKRQKKFFQFKKSLYLCTPLQKLRRFTTATTL